MFLTLHGICFANSEEVRLNYTNINKLKVPSSKAEMLRGANQMYEKDDIEDSYFIPEEELGDSNAEKAFYKFVNDKVINNKLNTYTMKLTDRN